MIILWRTVDPSERGLAFWNCNVLLDEEHRDLCRITAEKCDEGHIAVVCTVYGLMIRSLICVEDRFPDFCRALKRDLAALLEQEICQEEKETALCALFDRNTSVEAYRRLMNV